MNHIKHKQKQNKLKRDNKEKILEKLKIFQKLEEEMNKQKENP
jgi:hypothetical protein